MAAASCPAAAAAEEEEEEDASARGRLRLAGSGEAEDVAAPPAVTGLLAAPRAFVERRRDGPESELSELVEVGRTEEPPLSSWSPELASSG
jgi:hypothetical protein